MKRFHVGVAVKDLQRSVDFYTTLFGSDPAVREQDYAKWMLDNPRINFSISQSQRMSGISHVGIQVDSPEELGPIQARLEQAGEATFDQTDAKCCYANSTKTWVRDPDNVAWETFFTHGQMTQYGDDRLLDVAAANDSERCCGDTKATSCCA
jgi:catechol 2,3-dioxygenase-like lactoylglutathione lyase family enzyme